MKQLRMAMALVLGLATLPALAQTADPEDRLCTAGFNQDYGWFLTDYDEYGVLEFPGDLNSSCVPVTTAKLAAQLGGLTLPLSREVIYDLGANPSKVTLPLLEPALCEDYFAGSGGEAVWNLVVLDANGEPLFSAGAGAVKGVASLGYNLTTGALAPAMVPSYGNTPWLRCHSGLAPNAEITLPGGSEGDPLDLFADGYESPVYAPDLQIQFLDPATDELLTQDVMSQANTGDISFKVRVANVGNVTATDVRIREFLPFASPPGTPLGPVTMPKVERLACIDHGPSGTGTASCNNGIGGDRFAADISTLAPGDERDFTLTRRSTGEDLSDDQVQALIQIAAFSSPVDALDANYSDNSRSLRILVVDQISVSHGHTTNGVTGGNGGSIAISSVPPVCTTTGQITSCPPGTTGLTYSATANSGYTFTGFSGCAGTTTGESPTGGTFTTSGGTSCAVTASFQSMPIVTATAGNHGAITPASQLVHYNEPALLTITPDVGYTVNMNATTGCGGITQVSGTSWQTAPVTGDCAVSVSFAVALYTVTATTTGNGAVSPTSVLVQYEQSAIFTVTPAANHYVANITSTCPSFPGIWFNDTDYIVAGITGDCSVSFEFDLIAHNVEVSQTIQNGTIKFLDDSDNELPGTSVDIPHGQPVRFKPVADQGFIFSGSPSAVTATNCALQSLSWDFGLQAYVGVTQPITADNCILSATFSPE